VHLPLKFAIIRSGKSQRQISLDALIPETRLSDLVRGRGWPSSTEREALQAVLGADYFGEQDDALQQPAEAPSARR
jgi:hypothetical protein